MRPGAAAGIAERREDGWIARLSVRVCPQTGDRQRGLGRRLAFPYAVQSKPLVGAEKATC